MKRPVALFLTLLLLFSVCACSSSQAPGGIHTEKGDVNPKNFLKFDGKNVGFDQFRYYYLNYKDMYLTADADHFLADGAEDALKKEVLQCLLDQYAVTLLAKEYDIKLDREEKNTIRTQMDAAIAEFADEEAFLADLHASYMSEEHWEIMMENASLSQKLFDYLFEDGGSEAFSDEEFYEYFRKNYLAVQQIYLPFESGENGKECEKTLALAESILTEYENGADFWTLTETHGKDEAMKENPDGYYVTQGECEDVLYEASAALAVGEVSEPVIGSTGVYLIRRVEMKTERMDEKRDYALFGYQDAFGEWHAGKYDDVFMEIIRERAAKIEVKYGKYWDLVSTETVF